MWIKNLLKYRRSKVNKNSLIGFGYYDLYNVVQFHNVFKQGECTEFLNFISNEFGISEITKNAVLSFSEVNINDLIIKSINEGYFLFVDYLRTIKLCKNYNFVSIVFPDTKFKRIEESYLVLEMFNKGILSSLDKNDINFLRKTLSFLDRTDYRLYYIATFINVPTINYMEPENGKNIISRGNASLLYGSYYGNDILFMDGVVVGCGCVIADNNFVGTNSHIGDCTIIGTRNIIGANVTFEGSLKHKSKIGDDNIFSMGVVIGSNIEIANKCFIGRNILINDDTLVEDLRFGSKTYGDFINTKKALKNTDKLRISGKDDFIDLDGSCYREINFQDHYILEKNYETD